MSGIASRACAHAKRARSLHVSINMTATSPPAIVNVRFRVSFTRAELTEAFLQDAPAIAKLPALRWKIWAFDDGKREFASVYLFDDSESAKHFVDGEVISGLHSDPNLSEIRVEVHEIIERLTHVTRGPVE